MRWRPSTYRTAFTALLVGVLTVSAGGQGLSPETEAKRRYKAALALAVAGQHEKALKGFQEIVDTFPASRAAGDALVQIAFHDLDVAHDLEAARATAETVVGKYANQDAAAMAYVALGRITLARGPTPGSTEAALQHFQRALSLVPADAEAFPAALHGAAEALRLAGRCDEAAERYERVMVGYPRSTWAARAALGLASCLTRTGQVDRALAELQRMRLRFPGSPESERALAFNTILYRLYLLTRNGRPPFEFLPNVPASAPPVKRALAVAIGPRDVLHVLTGDGVSVFDATGAVADTIPASRARGLLFDPAGHAIVVRSSGLQTLRGTLISLTVAGPAKEASPLENLVAAATTSTGDLLVADGDRDTIERFPGAAWRLARMGDRPASGAASTEPALVSAPGPFARLKVLRLAVNSLDGAAAIQEGSRSVVVLGREGGVAAQIRPQGAGYELRNPVDIAYDALDHLYVLDRDSGTVWVFGPALGLVAAYTLPESAPGAFRRARALAVDAVGRLHIYDDRAQRVQVYQ